MTWLALGVVIALWFFGAPLRRRLVESATLMNDSPPPNDVEDMIVGAGDPVAAAVAAWETGKIVHRQVAIRQLPLIAPRPDRSALMRTILRSAALDPDLSVREAALAGLQIWQDPVLTALAAEQIKDRDPEVRALGLQYLRPAPAEVGVPLVMPLLKEGDPFFLTLTLKLLEKWSGRDFGVKLGDVTPKENPRTGLKEFRAGSDELARSGIQLAEQWWAEHRREFKPVPLDIPEEVRTSIKPLPAGDFVLPSLDGKPVRLSDFRGQVVLLNFWTTWCTACVSEMPELSELQGRHRGTLAVLGVSLDAVPDGHGHIGDQPTVEERNDPTGHSGDANESAGLTRLHEKIARTVRRRGVAYRILIDKDNVVGGRFNGGELPTTVILDADGFVRRRFIGPRSLAVLEAMLTEAGRPLSAIGRR